MKHFLAFFIVIALLAGCSSSDSEIDRAVSIRQKISQSNGCSFHATITADYGKQVYTFEMQCETDATGSLKFQVLAPESISGITGSVDGVGGKLTFDDTVLAFNLLADGQASPVSAPWLMVRTLRGGYLTSCCEDGEGLRMTIDDSYEDDALQLDIWTDKNDCPVYTEILFAGKRILTIEVANFSYL